MMIGLRTVGSTEAQFGHRGVPSRRGFRMSIEYPYKVRDPIHGLIRLSQLEWDVINSMPFQRLRRIRQLAFADLVYPGAHHTRFEHVLGTMHVAGRIISRLAREQNAQITDPDIVLVRMAALLHDIGHGPFSHVSEYLFEKFATTKKPPQIKREKIHEQITLSIFEHNDELRQLISTMLPELRNLLLSTGSRDYHRDIVSSNLDADKMDYLLRDGYYAGVRYGQYDIDQMIESFRIRATGSETYLMIDESGLFAFEQLVLAKHHMTQQVYAHRVRVITDAMIVRGLSLAGEDDPEIKKLYEFSDSAEYVEQYMTFDDQTLIDAILRCNSDKAKEIFSRLRQRRLYKELLVLPLTDRVIPDAVVLARLMNLTDEHRRDLEAEVAESLGCQPWQVIVHSKNIRNPAYPTQQGLDPEEPLVIDREGNAKRVSDFDEAVIAKFPSLERVHIIAPMDRSVGETKHSVAPDRRRLAGQIKGLVIDYIRKV